MTVYLAALCNGHLTFPRCPHWLKRECTTPIVNWLSEIADDVRSDFVVKSQLIRTIKIDDYLHGVDNEILREPILAPPLLDFRIDKVEPYA